MRELSTTEYKKLKEHVLDQFYIDNPDKFEQFVDSIGERFFNQLMEDKDYVYEPLKPLI